MPQLTASPRYLHAATDSALEDAGDCDIAEVALISKTNLSAVHRQLLTFSADIQELRTELKRMQTATDQIWEKLRSEGPEQQKHMASALETSAAVERISVALDEERCQRVADFESLGSALQLVRADMERLGVVQSRADQKDASSPQHSKQHCKPLQTLQHALSQELHVSVIEAIDLEREQRIADVTHVKKGMQECVEDLCECLEGDTSRILQALKRETQARCRGDEYLQSCLVQLQAQIVEETSSYRNDRVQSVLLDASNLSFPDAGGYSDLAESEAEENCSEAEEQFSADDHGDADGFENSTSVDVASSVPLSLEQDRYRWLSSIFGDP